MRRKKEHVHGEDALHSCLGLFQWKMAENASIFPFDCDESCFDPCLSDQDYFFMYVSQPHVIRAVYPTHNSPLDAHNIIR